MMRTTINTCPDGLSDNRFIPDTLNCRDNDYARAITWRPHASPDAEDAQVHSMKLREEYVVNTMAEFVRDHWHHFVYAACLAIAVVYCRGVFIAVVKVIVGFF
ncbi:hypothetical protein EON65_39545 [archaeon]|nr:MAG: hypothetical protein EON65_39545 [archaeon]